MITRLFIADDHKIMREGLKALITKETGMSVVGEAEDGKTAVSEAARLVPNVVVIDVAMPGLNGIEAARKIAKGNPRTKIIALSGHADQHLVREMLKAGASGYVLKHRAYEELLNAVNEVMKGKTYLSPEVTQGVVDTYVRGGLQPGQNPAFAVLTDREREVLQMLSEGRSTKEMADEMGVSVKTIETHRHNIMEKLHLYSVAELTKYAIREGVTSLET